MSEAKDLMEGFGLKDSYGKGLGLLQSAYPQRDPTVSERQFFLDQPSVAGYAAPDQSVVLNPSTREGGLSVLTNERIRQFLLSNPNQVPPDLSILPHQQFSQEYQAHPQMLQHSIIARILSGDPSGAPYSTQQLTVAQQLLQYLQMAGK